MSENSLIASSSVTSLDGDLDGRSFFYNRLQNLRPNAPEEEREIKSRAFLHVTEPIPSTTLRSSVMAFQVWLGSDRPTFLS